MSNPGAVIIGGFVNALGMVRALGARAIRTAVACTQPYDIAHRSRWCREHFSVDNLGGHPENLVAALQQRSARYRGWALLPTIDEALTALTMHHDELGRDFHLLAPPPEAARTFLDKHLMSEAARSLGISCPTYYWVAEPALLERTDFRFPVVVKPKL